MIKKPWLNLFLLTVFLILFITQLSATEIKPLKEEQNSFYSQSEIINNSSVSPNIAQASRPTISVTDVPGFTSVISALALTPDGQTLLVATGDGTINALDLTKSELIYTKTFVAQTRDVAATSDNNLFAVAIGKEIGIFSLKEQKILKRWPAHVEEISRLAISPDNQYLVSMSVAERTTKIWDLATGNLLKTLGEGEGISSTVVFNPQGRYLVTAANGNDRTFKFWDVQTWELLTTSPQQPGNIYDLAITSDGIKAIAAVRNTIKVWDLTTGAELLSWKAADLDLNAIAISPDSRILATADKEEKIKLWNLSNGQLLATLTGHKGWVLSLIFSPDGNYLYSGAEDRLVKIWQVGSIINPDFNQ